MSKKKDLKILIERIDAIEAEIKSLKETAEKNVVTISAAIEKLVAAPRTVGSEKPKAARAQKSNAVSSAKEETKAETKNEKKDASMTAERKPRTGRASEKNPSSRKTSAPKKQTTEKQKPKSAEQPKAARTKTPAAVNEGEKQEKKTRTWKGASFILYNCDEAKTPESMFNRNDDIFKDTGTGRRALWNKLKTEITEGRIELLNNQPVKNVQIDITGGNPESVNKYLKYGWIERLEGHT